MKAFVETIVKELVDLPDQVRITELAGEANTLYEVHVADSDLGKIIGKQGRIAHSVRAIVQAVGMKNKRCVKLEIVEN